MPRVSGLSLRALGVLLLFSCVSQDPVDHANRDDCPSEGRGSIALSISRYEVDLNLGPVVDVAAFSVDSVFFIGDGGRSLFLKSGGAFHRVLGGLIPPLTRLSKGERRLLATDGEGAFEIVSDEKKPLTLQPPLPLGDTIWDLAQHRRVFMAVVRRGSQFRFELYRRARSGKKLELQESQPLSGPHGLYMSGSGRTALADQTPPFAVSILDSTGKPEVEDMVLDLKSGLIAYLISGAKVVSLAAIPLNCGRVIRVLADEMSATRWLVLQSTTSGSIERVGQLNEPLGFVQGLIDERTLIGAIEKPGGRDLLTGVWSWRESANPSLGGAS